MKRYTVTRRKAPFNVKYKNITLGVVKGMKNLDQISGIKFPAFLWFMACKSYILGTGSFRMLGEQMICTILEAPEYSNKIFEVLCTIVRTIYSVVKANARKTESGLRDSLDSLRFLDLYGELRELYRDLYLFLSYIHKTTRFSRISRRHSTQKD